MLRVAERESDFPEFPELPQKFSTTSKELPSLRNSRAIQKFASGGRQSLFGGCRFVGGCQLKFWSLKLSWECFIERGEDPNRWVLWALAERLFREVLREIHNFERVLVIHLVGREDTRRSNSRMLAAFQNCLS